MKRKHNILVKNESCNPTGAVYFPHCAKRLFLFKKSSKAIKILIGQLKMLKNLSTVMLPILGKVTKIY